MRQIICIITILCFGFAGHSQEFDFLNFTEKNNQKHNKETFKHNLLNEIDMPVLTNSKAESEKESFVALQEKNDKFIKEVDFSLSMGTQIGVANKDMYYANSYISPSAKFKINDKLSVQTGIGYSYGLMQDYFLYNPERAPNGSMMNVNSIFAYASAIYSLSPRTSILASGIVDYNMFSMNDNNKVNQTYSSVSLGVNYKVTSSFSINAQINYGNNPNYSTQFTPGGMHFSPAVGF